MMLLPSMLARALYILTAVVWCAVQYYQVVVSGYEYEIILLATHVCAAISVVLLSRTWRGQRRETGEPIVLLDVVLVLAAIAVAIYLAMQGERLSIRMHGVSAVKFWDKAFGTLLLLLLLEACRRASGLVLTVVGLVFILYALYGAYLPSEIGHRGLEFRRFIDLQILSTSGVFSSPVSASAQMVFYFVMVGAFLERSGASRLFTSIAYSMTARSWGGAGKASVVSSGLFGMISGSAVSNVLVAGTMTIPLMIRAGFKRRVAGAIEATASTGGQLAPPIMGAAAFIMAEMVGVPYAEVVQAAIVPAALYFLSIFMLVHAYSRRENLVPDNSYGFAQYSREFRAYWHLLLPIVFMIVMLMNRYSLMFTGTATIIVTILISQVRSDTRLTPRMIYEAAMSGTRVAADVAVPCAVAGTIVGTLVYTGLAVNLQQFILGFADGALLLTLFGGMVMTIVFGMGMPTAAAYLLGAILVAPGLQELGVPRLLAHLFVFYFGILSMVTPPVALCSYAAAGLAKGNVWRLSVTAFVIAVPGFLIPFGFVQNPALVLQGELAESVRIILTVGIGVVTFSMAAGGYFFGMLAMPVRLVLCALSVLTIFPEPTTTTAGLIGIGGASALQLLRGRMVRGMSNP
ncbi:MAG: TRAP transporter fused permease subunit [Spiribacter salinus]|uniref:TRAP transporter fused permease subunit n=1 Tax=Spiribacter salinus TaxID=1335746 RepID=A0A540VSH8_9GAMM|nr:MAG: TRAP transporter fused permease subunit [Spiribacter salinus]